MHLIYIPQCTIQNRNVYISVLNGAFWEKEQVNWGELWGKLVYWTYTSNHADYGQIHPIWTD